MPDPMALLVTAIESCIRVLALATPAKKLKAFRTMLADAPGLVRAGAPKPDVVDGFREAGINAGLTEFDVDDVIAGTFRPPDETIPSPANGGRYAVPRPSTKVEWDRMDEIEPRPVEWLWLGRVARGKLTLIAGDPGLGKSQIAIDMTARVTTAAAWPDDGRAPGGSVVMLSAEDSAADTLRPRLEAAGADLARVHRLRAVIEITGRRRTFNLGADLDQLAAKVGELGDVAMIVIDPITSYMGVIDSHRTTDVRAVLEPVADLAERCDVAIVAISHPPKAAPAKAIHAVTGSLAYVAAARLVFLVIDEPETESGRRLLLATKNNLGALAAGLGYHLIQRLVGPKANIVASYVHWDAAAVMMTAGEALHASSDDGARAALRDAKDFLRGALAAGEAPATAIEDEASLVRPDEVHDCRAPPHLRFPG